jgi:hypothetical protein
MIIFVGTRKKIQFQDELLPGGVGGMSDLGLINEHLLLGCLKLFLKFKSEDNILLILRKHVSHTSCEVV